VFKLYLSIIIFLLKRKGLKISLIPAFKIGLLNAWILVIPILILYVFSMRVTAARESGRSGDFKITKKENIIIYSILLVMFIAFIYAIFLPLQLSAIWLFSGLFIYLFGIAFTIVAVWNFATSPKDKVITKGLYSVSRNPMYAGILLTQIGLGIACSSWLYLFLTVVLMILLNADLPAEERYCLYMYGDKYRKYRNRTPRWIGIPKS
jgi:protein-S-isoprenylcysteine O-methyltransferase Ste14